MTTVSHWRRVPCPTCGQSHKLINGGWLRAKREASGLSLRGFAALRALSPTYISDIERNVRRCPVNLVAAYLLLKPPTPPTGGTR